MVKRVYAALLLCAFLILTGCKAEPLGESSEKHVVSEPIQSVVSVESEETGAEGIESAVADDAADPENVEPQQQGSTVTAEQLEQKSGKENGIDVSKWQGRIDWKAVAADGIDFAIIRIGYRAENGTLYRDSNADYNIQQAQAAGIKVGVYFFSTAVNAEEAREEAQWAASAVAGYKISYPIVYDCEGFAEPTSRMYTLTASERTANALAFLDAVSGYGYDGMFYGAKADLEAGCWDMANIEARYKVWLAYYTSPTYPTVETPTYSGRYDMWQYTNCGTVDGVGGNVDMAVSYFTKDLAAEKDASATPEAAEPPKTQEEMLYTDINDEVTAKDEVNLREGPSTSYNIVGKLTSGEFLTRTAVGTNGWSKLLYNGQTVYAITSYLSNEVIKVEKPDVVDGSTFTPANDSVTAKDEVNLRDKPSTDGNIVGKLTAGTFLNRTAMGDKGWSRLDFNGTVVYAVTSYLTTELTENTEELAEPSTADDGFTDKAGRLTAKEETNLRDKPTTDGSTVIYTLKNGEYVELLGVSDSGWAKLLYDGQTVYAIYSYLTE